jgi:hypothetical protein
MGYDSTKCIEISNFKPNFNNISFQKFGGLDIDKLISTTYNNKYFKKIKENTCFFSTDLDNEKFVSTTFVLPGKFI